MPESSRVTTHLPNKDEPLVGTAAELAGI